MDADPGINPMPHQFDPRGFGKGVRLPRNAPMPFNPKMAASMSKLAPIRTRNTRGSQSPPRKINPSVIPAVINANWITTQTPPRARKPFAPEFLLMMMPPFQAGRRIPQLPRELLAQLQARPQQAHLDVGFAQTQRLRGFSHRHAFHIAQHEN